MIILECVEIYDDEIRYNGKTIHRGLIKNMSRQQIDGIVELAKGQEMESIEDYGSRPKNAPHAACSWRVALQSSQE